jgi:hypothetical protein
LSVDVPVVSDEDCNSAYAGQYNTDPVKPSMMCAGGASGKCCIRTYKTIKIYSNHKTVFKQVGLTLAREILVVLFSLFLLTVTLLKSGNLESFPGEEAVA